MVALAACGGTTTSESLEDAAKQTAESSSRIELRYEVSNGLFRGSMAGAFDYAGQSAEITAFDFTESEQWSGDPSQPTEVRVVDGVDYVGYEVEGKRYWVKETRESDGDPFALLFPIPGSAHDPSDVFSMVLRASEKVEHLGSETVRGDEATHYRASVDLRKLAAEVAAAERDEFLDGMGGDVSLPVDVWVDHESRLRRISMRQEIDKDVSMLMTFELFDFGVEVDVEPPPADQLITQERLDELTRPTEEELEALCREELPKGESDLLCKETEAKE